MTRLSYFLPLLVLPALVHAQQRAQPPVAQIPCPAGQSTTTTSTRDYFAWLAASLNGTTPTGERPPAERFPCAPPGWRAPTDLKPWQPPVLPADRPRALVHDYASYVVREPPPAIVARYKLDTSFYKQYVDANGYPILASAKTPAGRC